MNAIVPAATAARAFLQADLLRHLGGPSPSQSFAGLARVVGRDESNVRKTVKGLQADGLLDGWQLTPIGERALLALDVAEGSADVANGIPDLLFLNHGRIQPNPLNPRTEFEEEGLAELADSIAGVDQILVPLIVFPADPSGMHLLAAGERRWRAVRKLITDGRWPADRPLPCLECENDPAQAALIGLVENGQRTDLNLWDQAQAYVALMEATGWSAREAALKTGKSPRAVQEAVQVARNAHPDHVAAFRAHEITWEDLRNGVRKPIERPAPEVELAAALASSGPASLASGSAEQIDIEEVTAGRVAVAIPPGPGQLGRAPKPRELLMLVEIAHKIARSPAAEWGGGRCTRCAEPYPDRNGLSTALVGFGGGFAMGGGLPTMVTLGHGCRSWLEQVGKMPSGAENDAILRNVRVEVLGLSETLSLERGQRYSTPWLNLDHKPATTPTTRGLETPQSAAPRPISQVERDTDMVQRFAERLKMRLVGRRESGGPPLVGPGAKSPQDIAKLVVKAFHKHDADGLGVALAALHANPHFALSANDLLRDAAGDWEFEEAERLAGRAEPEADA